MKRILTVLMVSAGLAGCGAGNVYDDPIPSSKDTDALTEIRDGLKPEDREAWQRVAMRLINPLSKGVLSKTVGEAIQKEKAKTACMEKNDVRKAGEMPRDIGAPDYAKRNAAHTVVYNKLVDAYNACLKMEV